MPKNGGILSGGFQPLKAPDAPTIDSVSAGVLSADVTFSAPANTGEGSVDSYVITAKQSDGTSVSQTASAAGTASVTLTVGGTTTFAAQAISEYGPGQFSGFGNSTSVLTGQELYAWGRNTYGQIGNSTTIDRSSPVQIGSLTNWANVSAGKYHSTAVKTDGTLWAWGQNTFYGALGDGTKINKNSPIQIGALTNWSETFSRDNSSFAIKTDGTLWAWGKNSDGQLGDGTITYKSSPVQIGSETWSVIAHSINSSDHTFGITTSGKLYAWGDNTTGRLGLGDTVKRSSPTQVGSLTNWSQVSAGFAFGFAINESGELYAWGNNYSGQLAQNNTTNRSSPVQIGALTNWSQVSAGQNEFSAIKTNGTLWGSGLNTSGQLADGTEVNKSSPVQIGALTTWSQVSAGFNGKAAVKTDGTLWSWGENNSGQVGDNTVNISKSSPVQIGSDTSWTAVSRSMHVLGLIGTTS